jgi:hypothetical protein
MKEIKRILFGTSPIGMNGKLSKVTTALLSTLGTDFTLNGQRSNMQRQIASSAGFSNLRVLVGSTLCGSSLLLLLGICCAEPVESGHSLGESQRAAAPFRAGMHQSRVPPGQAFGETQQMTAPELAEYLKTTPATRSTFLAVWEPVAGAVGYQLDVATDAAFTHFVPGYRDLNVGNITGRTITGLTPGTTYYYRVRSYSGSGVGASSEATTEMTMPTTGLTIHPTFDTSITGNANSAAIQAAISRAIAIYENLFSDPVTIEIRFRFSSVDADGTPIPLGFAARSYSGLSIQPWSTYIDRLRADATTSNDATANNSLPLFPLAGHVTICTANGRAVGLNTPTLMFADSSVGPGGPYDGVVTLNSSYAFQFTRPPVTGRADAQEFLEHEMDEVIGLGSYLDCTYCQDNDVLRAQDLFSWAYAGGRNLSSSGTRYFSINSGATRIVDFNQDPNNDRGDWFSPSCPQTTPHVQNAVNCLAQSSDISATSPEGVNLDVIGYDLRVSGPTTSRFDFNRDGNPDFVLMKFSSGQTGIGYMNNNVLLSGVHGPTLSAGWMLIDIADFNRDGKPDYLLFNPTSLRSAIWYMNNNALVSSAYGPTLQAGWTLVGAGDFNRDGKPDFVVFNPMTHQTVIWYMDNNVYLSLDYGPTLSTGWRFVGAADFDRDGKTDYLLFNQGTRQSAICYMNDNVLVTVAYGPTLPAGFTLIGTADFNRDGKTDFVLFHPSTGHTALWYLNNNSLVGGAYGPVVAPGWALTAP